MTKKSSFSAEMQHPDGRCIRIEAQSYRDVVFQIRFYATIENARLMTRGPIPENFLLLYSAVVTSSLTTETSTLRSVSIVLKNWRRRELPALLKVLVAKLYSQDPEA